MEKNSSLAWAIAKVIREEREKKGLTQGQLAGLSGLSETYISFIVILTFLFHLQKRILRILKKK